MFGPQSANPETPGHTGKIPGPLGSGVTLPSAHTGKDAPLGSGIKYAAGGSGKMFGFNPSQPAKAGQTGAR